MHSLPLNDFPNHLENVLRRHIQQNNQCTMVICAGNTIAQVLPQLNDEIDLWKHINIMPSDERWVDTNSRHSNDRFLKSLLPAYQSFFSLKKQTLPEQAVPILNQEICETPFHKPDIIILSMAADGHIASLFPGNSKAFMNSKNAFITTHKPMENFARLSITPAYMKNAAHIYLLISDQDKYALWKKARDSQDIDRYPALALLSIDTPKLCVFSNDTK